MLKILLGLALAVAILLDTIHQMKDAHDVDNRER